MSMLFLVRVFAFAVVVALHRVCIRTLMSRMDLDSVRLGFERRVDAAIIRRSWETKTLTQSSERGVDATNEQDHLQAAC